MLRIKNGTYRCRPRSVKDVERDLNIQKLINKFEKNEINDSQYLYDMSKIMHDFRSRKVDKKRVVDDDVVVEEDVYAESDEAVEDVDVESDD